MPVVTEDDGSITLPVNIYKDLYLLRYVFCDIAFDTASEVVLCTEGGRSRGTLYTLVQSHSGFNITTKDGFNQFLASITPPTSRSIQFMKRDYETPEAMFKLWAKCAVLGRVPKQEESSDEFLVDILLLPKADRLQHVYQVSFEQLVHNILRVIKGFSDKTTFASYKPRYREKLLTLASNFYPYRKDFESFEIDPDYPEDDASRLLLFFS